jgi:serine/threonine protein kinase
MAETAGGPRDPSDNDPPRYVAARYRLDTPIGRGGAGVVWCGEDELLQRPVAIKEILVSAGTQAERDSIKARVLREARALARLHSPAIVSVYDVVQEAERHWIVMELVDADSLGDVIRNEGPLRPAQVAAIGLALIDALAAAHSAGVLHRDVKPGNVLLGRDGRVRLTDFGIAATEGEATLTGTGSLVGSPAYIAPERVRGSSGTPASDLWGLAATLYAAAEGQPPFEGPETYAVLTAVVEGRRQPFRLAGPLRPLLVDLLDRPAAQRPGVEEIRRRLIPIARGVSPVPASVINGRPRDGVPAGRLNRPADPADPADLLEPVEAAGLEDYVNPSGTGDERPPDADDAPETQAGQITPVATGANPITPKSLTGGYPPDAGDDETNLGATNLGARPGPDTSMDETRVGRNTTTGALSTTGARGRVGAATSGYRYGGTTGGYAGGSFAAGYRPDAEVGETGLEDLPPDGGPPDGSGGNRPGGTPKRTKIAAVAASVVIVGGAIGISALLTSSGHSGADPGTAGVTTQQTHSAAPPPTSAFTQTFGTRPPTHHRSTQFPAVTQTPSPSTVPTTPPPSTAPPSATATPSATPSVVPTTGGSSPSSTPTEPTGAPTTSVGAPTKPPTGAPSLPGGGGL